MKPIPARDATDLERALRQAKPRPDRRLGELLLAERAITQAQLQQVLSVQANGDRRHLGELLVEMGCTSQEQVNIALADKLGIPYVSLDEFDMSRSPISLIPPDLALQYSILPLAVVHGVLIVAMDNPFNWEALEVLRFHSNQNVEPVLSSAHSITTALNKFYSHFDEDALLEELETTTEHLTPQPAAHLVVQEANKAPVVRLLNAVIAQAIQRQASDINIRPEKDRVNVYYRIDGSMQFVRSFHRSLLLPLVSRVKITGQMDISERRLPQDGHARVFHDKRPIDLRLSIIPTVVGESVVIRILDKAVGLKPLDGIGLPSQELDRVKEIITRPNGMFLVVGPTGSGKSTTLYAILNEVRKSNPHIITVEDPVEYHIEGLEQIQTLSSRGYTFAEALRHILRHDPDVIMVGEIRDTDTVQIANKAALTGHLVLSTLHTNDAPSTVTRLLDMGVEPFLLSTTLLGVMSQRLVRLNCPHCLEEDVGDNHMRRTLGVDAKQVMFRGRGCPSCNFTGYHGRYAVCELLVMTPELRQLINEGANSQRIKQLAIAQGMTPLVQNALALAREARTSLEEVYSVRIE